MKRFLALCIALLLPCTAALGQDTQKSDAEALAVVEAAAESIGFLRERLNDRYTVLINAQSSTDEIQARLAPIEAEVATLSDQLATLDANVVQTGKRIQAYGEEIGKTQLRLKDTLELEAVREKEYLLAADALREFVRLSYADMQVFFEGGSEETSLFRVAAGGEAFADAELRGRYVKMLEGTLFGLMQRSIEAREEYQKLKEEALVTRGNLVLLMVQAEKEAAQLDELREAKRRILEETKGEEEEYKKLVEKYAKEQADAMREIEELKEQMTEAGKKLKEISGDLGDEKIRDILLSHGFRAVDTEGVSFTNTPRFIWPGDPGRGITAYFKDPEYRAVFGVLHYAVDFRMYQGSPVMAAGPGVVIKVRDAGSGYSYIAIAHPDDFQTVYGHMSGFSVKVGDTVTAGQMIGFSGGSPGTKGAGLMTTGPHMHFEIHKNGEPVDPLEYLPLEYLPLADIPEKYIAKEEG